MIDNYPPGAADDPNAPYNQIEPDEVDYKVSIEIFNSEEGDNEKKDVQVTIEQYLDTDYSKSDITALLEEELDKILDDEYSILDYEYL